jgi:hypothetical protein
MVMLAARFWTLAALCAALIGCGSLGRYESSPRHTVDLSGNWTLNRAASEDPKPVIDGLRPKPTSRRWQMPDDDDSGPQDGGSSGPQPGGGGTGGRGSRSRRGSANEQPQYAYRSGNEAFSHGMVLKMLSADIARAENLTIHQSPDRLTIDYGNSIRSFTPGARSVVSAAWGVADQSSGWKGKEFVIAVKPQSGVATTETFSLSDDGKHLLEDLRMGGGDFPAIRLKRVYDQADHPVQRTVPTSD